jgi:hypothetical protein
MGATAKRCAATPFGVLAWLCLLSAASGCGGKSRFIDDSEPKSEPDSLMLLDDMEPDESEDREYFSWAGGAVGHWWSPGSSEHDVVEDIVPPREGSTGGCRIAGSGGGTLAAILLFPWYYPVSLGEFRGLVFHARLQSTSGRLVVALSGEGQSRSPAFSVSPDWERFELSFDELSPTWDGDAATIDFIADQAGPSFELWIDDVSLVCRGACPTYDDE